jgi:hypothetical protein
MATVESLRELHRCEGAHADVVAPPPAVLCIDGVEDAFILLCRACAERLIRDIQTTLAALELDPRTKALRYINAQR